MGDDVYKEYNSFKQQTEESNMKLVEWKRNFEELQIKNQKHLQQIDTLNAEKSVLSENVNKMTKTTKQQKKTISELQTSQNQLSESSNAEKTKLSEIINQITKERDASNEKYSELEQINVRNVENIKTLKHKIQRLTQSEMAKKLKSLHSEIEEFKLCIKSLQNDIVANKLDFEQQIVSSNQFMMKMHGIYSTQKKNILIEFEEYKTSSKQAEQQYLEQMEALKLKTSEIQTKIIKSEKLHSSKVSELKNEITSLIRQRNVLQNECDDKQTQTQKITTMSKQNESVKEEEKCIENESMNIEQSAN